MSTATQATVTAVEQLKLKLDARAAKIGVVGLGYVGLPLVLLFSEQKFGITGFDIDSSKIEFLNSGRSYIVRITPEEVNGARAAGFKATADYSRIADMDAVIICVPTPLDEYREPDMSYIEKTAKAIAPYVHGGQLIVLESTTYPGTTEDLLIPILEKGNMRGLKVARGEDFSEKDFFVAFSPEREDPGNTDVARFDIPKVIGGVNAAATDMARSVYSTIFRRTVPVSSPAAAEMTKLLENIYRCVNIAMVNELKLLCLRMGIDIWEVIEAAKTKPFGFQAFYPGPGLGGHCIPVDPYYLSWKAREFDFTARFIELAGDVNSGMPYHVVQSVAKALNGHKKSLNGSKVLVLGVAYKKDIDDLRESPSLTIIEKLKEEGAEVSYNDPFFPSVGKGRHYDLQMKNTPLENLGQFDCVLIVTDHTEYDYKKIVAESKLVVDSRNATKGIKSPKIVLC
jgi:UDP-N-acetyl-D-glucosamine dehydrogenase